MTLLERTPILNDLVRLLAEATARRGHMVVLGGEAGVGKTSLVQELGRMTAPSARIATGHCDPLSTPRPLGPLLDMADALGGPGALGLAGNRDQLYGSLLSTLAAHPQPTLLIVEDLHWADEATLDLLRFLGRRIGSLPALLIATYRDDEVGPQHPMQVMLGDLATSGAVRHWSVPPLSERAVAQLAEGSDLDTARLYRQTGGNPFFVTEVLAARDGRIPTSVRDAVLARVARLSSSAQAVLGAAAVIGPQVDARLLTRVVGAELDALDACLEVGLLVAQEGAFTFRHELTRQAILSTLAPHRQAVMQALVLDALRASAAPDLARLAHHAEAAGDGAAVLEFAPRAAERAAGLGAHREAAAQYARALRFAQDVPTSRMTSLLEAYAVECALIDHLQEAIQARHRAAALWRQEGHRLKVGENLSHLSGLYLNAGENAQGEAAIRAALDVLSALPPGVEHARAYQMQAHLHMLNRDHTDAVRLAEQALELAQQWQYLPVVIGAYNTLGTSRLLSADFERGGALLEQSLHLALDAGLDGRASTAYVNLGSGYGEMYRFVEADRYLTEGITYCRERDLDAGRLYMEAWWALSLVHQGRWAEGAGAAAGVLREPRVAAISRIMALVALGRVRARRGDPEVWPVLDEVLTLATTTGTLQRLGPVHAARAEAAHLASAGHPAASDARATYQLAMAHRHPWFVGELAYWSWKAGDLGAVPEAAAHPYALQMRGDWAGAAAAWQALSCPYEAARALADSGEEDPLKEALDVFERLGARPMAQRVARQLRTLGVRGVTRGPRPSTLANPAGLTTRELEVLDLLAGGQSNKQIARHLELSVKTVGHHVSAILAKLDLNTRGEAAAAARRLGLGALK